ncbi:hypothetical protein PF008_g4598 [Phytophthora fragariae]|uniref:Uncharacterized protein n=1 Tax=Phytophthora fragariae TaxID=53985 RepID=A0A6G0SBF5_9STRA|nr:hypothetical protein PF008_g4598 [Phytophthora fragariae]
MAVRSASCYLFASFSTKLAACLAITSSRVLQPSNAFRSSNLPISVALTSAKSCSSMADSCSHRSKVFLNAVFMYFT